MQPQEASSCQAHLQNSTQCRPRNGSEPGESGTGRRCSGENAAKPGSLQDTKTTRTRIVPQARMSDEEDEDSEQNNPAKRLPQFIRPEVASRRRRRRRRAPAHRPTGGRPNMVSKVIVLLALVAMIVTTCRALGGGPAPRRRPPDWSLMDGVADGLQPDTGFHLSSPEPGTDASQKLPPGKSDEVIISQGESLLNVSAEPKS